jgi:hypothetical protein
MKYHVWIVDANLNQVSLVKQLSNNKKSLKGKWQIFVKGKKKENLDYFFNGYGYKLKVYTTDEVDSLECIYAVFDDRNDIVNHNQPSLPQQKKEKE